MSPAKSGLTHSEIDERIRSAISAYVAAKGYGPSFREVAAAVGLSLSSTAWNLERMIDEGQIAHTPKTPRTLRVVHEEST